MPVVRTDDEDLHPGNRPDWSEVTGAGRFSVKTEGGWFDRHHHDFNEYWLIFAGKAKVMSEGREYYVKPGDIVCTAAHEEHDFIEVYEDVAAFYFEDACPEGGRLGHLHTSDEQKQGHAVPAMPVPDDFPQ